MIFTSLILTLIAFLFLRIQIRAIQRLANSAKEFGDGKKIKKFKPEGAMEIRQAGNSFIQMSFMKFPKSYKEILEISTKLEKQQQQKKKRKGL